MDQQLDGDIYSNDVEYFFSLHGPRFEYMNRAMADSLSKRFGKEFRPICILNAWPGEAYSTGNYIVLNKTAYKLVKELGHPVVALPDYEDVNVEFANSKEVQRIATKLLKKQQTVFVFPFTTSFLDLPPEIFSILGPDSKLARHYDNKIHQLKLFQKLKLPHVKATIYPTQAELFKHIDSLLPSYISAAYTSGGSESALVHDQDSLDALLARLRDINKENSFIAADVFDDIVLETNVNAIVTATGKTHTLVVADQIMNGNRYLGNLYPSLINKKQLKLLHYITQTIGAHLAKEGYRGLFGCDFLINRKGDVVVVDLNPRHQGGYACNGLALQQKGIYLTDIELRALFDEEPDLAQKELDTQLPFAWAHRKLVPKKGQVVQHEYLLNDIEYPFKVVGGAFAAEFYKAGSEFMDGYIGYQVQTTRRRDELEAHMNQVKHQFDERVLASDKIK